MTVRVNKSAFNIREKLSELERPIGVKGNELMRAETAQDARDLVSAGRKNIFINGDMMIAQRGTSSSSFGATNGEFSSVDRWQHFKIGTTNALWTASQDTDAPDGYRYSLKYDCTTADASPAGSARHQFQQKIEAYNTNHLGFGTSSAKDLVMSFWVKATLPGVNYGWIYDNPNNIFFPFRYYINSSNTWEKKVITIPGNTANTMSGTNGASLICAFPLYMGSNYTANAYDNPGVWQTWNSTNYGKFKDSTNHASSTNNNFWITGLQLEVGKNATEFEHRSYGEELALCQRYYQKSYPTEVTPGTNVTSSLGFAGMEGRTGMSNVSSTGEHFRGTKLFPSMRTTPNVTVYDRVGNAGKITGTKYLVADTDNVTGPVQNVCATGFQVKCINVGDFGGISFHYTADAEL